MTQKKKILDHLQKIGSITPKESWERYGIYRLSSVIHKLRTDGYGIETITIEHRNPNDGNVSHYAKYVYVQPIRLGDNYKIPFGGTQQ